MVARAKITNISSRKMYNKSRKRYRKYLLMSLIWPELVKEIEEEVVKGKKFTREVISCVMKNLKWFIKYCCIFRMTHTNQYALN